MAVVHLRSHVLWLCCGSSQAVDAGIKVLTTQTEQFVKDLEAEYAATTKKLEEDIRLQRCRAGAPEAEEGPRERRAEAAEAEAEAGGPPRWLCRLCTRPLPRAAFQDTSSSVLLRRHQARHKAEGGLLRHPLLRLEWSLAVAETLPYLLPLGTEARVEDVAATTAVEAAHDLIVQQQLATSSEGGDGNGNGGGGGGETEGKDESESENGARG